MIFVSTSEISNHLTGNTKLDKLSIRFVSIKLSDFEVKYFNLKFASKFKFYVQVGSSTVDRGGAVIQNLVGIRVSHIEVEISL